MKYVDIHQVKIFKNGNELYGLLFFIGIGWYTYYMAMWLYLWFKCLNLKPEIIF